MITFKKIDFDPRIWGPKGWFFLETIVQSLPDELDKDLEHKIKNYFISTAIFLPCTFCTKHMNEYIIESKLKEIDFSKKHYVVKWLNDLHNLRLSNDKQRTVQNVMDYYKDKYDANHTHYIDLYFIFITIVTCTLLLKYLINK